MIKSQNPKAGQSVSTTTRSVVSWHCQSKKSLSRFTPDVRTRMSTGGFSDVYVLSVTDSTAIVSGSGYRRTDEWDGVMEDEWDDDGGDEVEVPVREPLSGWSKIDTWVELEIETDGCRPYGRD